MSPPRQPYIGAQRQPAQQQRRREEIPDDELYEEDRGQPFDPDIEDEVERESRGYREPEERGFFKSFKKEKPQPKQRRNIPPPDRRRQVEEEPSDDYAPPPRKKSGKLGQVIVMIVFTVINIGALGLVALIVPGIKNAALATDSILFLHLENAAMIVAILVLGLWMLSRRE